MKMPEELSIEMLAPCGINCGVCYMHLRHKKPCPGCWGQDISKPGHCWKCKIKDCAAEKGVAFCFNCSSFPCALIKRLDKSYRQRYQVSLIDNAVQIKTVGATQFLREEQGKWMCVDCGGVISLHDRVCSECGKVI